MTAVLIDVGSPVECEPVTSTRPLSACPVRNRPLAEVQRERLEAVGLRVAEDTDGDDVLRIRSDAWLSAQGLSVLSQADHACVFTAADGVVLAWIGPRTLPDNAVRTALDPDSFRIRYPWDLIRINEELVGGLSEDRVEGTVAAGVVIEGTVHIGTGTRLLPGVFVEGNVVIGADCKIGPNCYIRGNTSIGNGCHIGQAVEIKNSILMDRVSIGHLSYCGDSIIGEGANFGAGTVTANFRHDGGNHRSMVGDQLLDTGRRKLGAILGDEVHTGIHTSIYPGRKMWPGVSTRPGTVVQRDLVSHSRPEERHKLTGISSPMIPPFRVDPV